MLIIDNYRDTEDRMDRSSVQWQHYSQRSYAFTLGKTGRGVCDAKEWVKTMSNYTALHSSGNLNSHRSSNGHSDSEIETREQYYSQSFSQPFPAGSGTGTRYTRLRSIDGNDTDPEDDDKRSTLSIDEFGENQNYATRLLRTGRQRKKLAARSKGGEFRQRRKKRRLYFCCLSSEIDVQKLFDHLVGAESLSHGWKYQLYADVLHLYKAGIEESQPKTVFSSANSTALQNSWGENGGMLNVADRQLDDNTTANEQMRIIHGSSANGGNAITESPTPQWSDSSRISGIGAQEVFVFDFGSAVFWGFSRGEETNLLKTIRMFVTKGFVHAQEFQSGEDDMAFVCAPTADTATITIANDVITLPDDTTTKQRMSVSFAIAQSTVLAIFEARVELKVEDYRYIPETLAVSGKVQLSERQLGMMIGEVFVIRHDVNLHTEILDTPDFFWKEELFLMDYKMVMRYLEMSGRTEVLNKRLDMLRELLDVLQQQMENAHAVKLEWIVIWLIVIEVVLQVFAIGGQSIGLWPAIPS